MSKLLVVSSPGMVRKVARYLQDGWTILPLTLPARDFREVRESVNLLTDYAPKFVELESPELVRIKGSAKRAEAVYIATPPGRAGELAAWHLIELLGNRHGHRPICRVEFNALDERTILNAISSPRGINRALVGAELAGRMSARLIKGLISPYASRELNAAVEASPLDMTMLRMVVERGREIATFKEETVWTIKAYFEKHTSVFAAALTTVRDKHAAFKTRAHADQFVKSIEKEQFWVHHIDTKDIAVAAPPPLTLRELYDAAEKTLGFSPDKTSHIAQTLYEHGLISAPPAESAPLLAESKGAAVDYLLGIHPPEYAQSLFSRQDVKGAIYPVRIVCTPHDLKPGDGAALYNLIRSRFIASLLADARYQQWSMNICCGESEEKASPIHFEIQGYTKIFGGFSDYYVQDDTPCPSNMPPIASGERLHLRTWTYEERHQSPPMLYSEGSLFRELNKHRIGDPAQYASALSRLIESEWVHRTGAGILPTEKGRRLDEFLGDHFPRLFTPDYMAALERGLLAIEQGHKDRSGFIKTMLEEELIPPLKVLAASTVTPSIPEHRKGEPLLFTLVRTRGGQ
jgi:DNA topoisomerase I